MLPFLQKHKSGGIASVIMSKRQPDGSIGQASPESSEEAPDGLESAAQDMIDAMEKKDVKALASAIRAAFDMLESEPHDEAKPSEMLEHLK